MIVLNHTMILFTVLPNHEPTLLLGLEPGTRVPYLYTNDSFDFTKLS